MTYYWSVYKLPELAGMDKREAIKIWRVAAMRAMGDPMYWLAFMPTGACGGIGAWIGGSVGAGIGGGIGAILSLPFMFNAARPHVAAVVSERQNETTIGESD